MPSVKSFPQQVLDNLSNGLKTSVLADDGVLLPISSLAQVLSYISGNISTISVSYEGEDYIQTFGYTGDDLTSISAWEKQ